MGIAQQIRRYTPEDYYRLEEKADSRSDFYNGEICAMAGGSARHAMIGGNIYHRLRNRLEGTPCVPFGSDLRLKVIATGLRTYPDVSVYCGKRELDPEDPAGQTYTNPSLLVEVLSPITEEYDRGTKAYHYRRIESLEVLWLVSQDMPRVEVHLRQTDGSWSLREHDGLDNILRLDTLGIQLPFSEIYQAVDFTTDQ